MTKHTEGPWVIFSAGGQSSLLPAGREGEICSFSIDPAPENLALMAAAPEMFKALCEVAVLGHGKCTIGKPLADMVRHAVEKAGDA